MAATPIALRTLRYSRGLPFGLPRRRSRCPPTSEPTSSLRVRGTGRDWGRSVRRTYGLTVRRYRSRRMTGTRLLAEPSSPWFWESVAAITLVLVSLNVLLIVSCTAAGYANTCAEAENGGSRPARSSPGEPRCADRLRDRTGCDGSWPASRAEQPLAAVALIERLRPASPEERRQMLAVSARSARSSCSPLGPKPRPMAACARGQDARLGRRGGDGSCPDRADRRP